MFGPDELRKLIETRLNTNQSINIPEGHRGAFFTFLGSDGNLNAGVAIRLGNGWKIQGSVDVQPHESDELKAGLQVLKTW